MNKKRSLREKTDVALSPAVQTNNNTLSRRALSPLAGQHFGGQRDLYEVMGYPRALAIGEFIDAYNRQDIAGRIIDAYPDATWREAPEVIGQPGFAEAWKQLNKRVDIWQGFHRLDRLTGMGHYGVLFLGLDGGEPTHLAINAATQYNLLYVQPHSERTAQITQWEDDPRSPRFGRPKMYNITTGVNWMGSGAGQRTLRVHHSRVIHVAERALEDVSIGVPRLERIWNRLMDLDKLLGGSAEMYWQNVAMMMAFIADADAEWEPEEKADMKAQLEEMMNGLRRQLRLRGVEVQQLAPGLQGASPGDHVDKQLDIIAGATGIPKRILLGTESGELASSQDENNWSGRIVERREQFAGPSIIEPFMKAGMRLGFLPRGGFECLEWPEADSLGETARSDIALKKAQTVQTIMNSPGAETVVTMQEVRNWLGEGENLPELPPELPLPESDTAVADQFRVNRRSPWWSRTPWMRNK